MRWQPSVDRCPECNFDWLCDQAEAVRIVARGAPDVEQALAGLPEPSSWDGGTWSPTMYVWHLVDVLRIGTERLLTLSLDPQAGIPCWDENALAAVRKYELLPRVVGLRVLKGAAQDWMDAVDTVPDGAQVDHAVFGRMSVRDIARRDAHEVHHHVGDIIRGRAQLSAE